MPKTFSFLHKPEVVVGLFCVALGALGYTLNEPILALFYAAYGSGMVVAEVSHRFFGD